jgi:chemotaxis protein CheY-P-specific phosphatase CheC
VSDALNESQRDALCELTNIAAGHGAEALSRLLSGDRIGFQPPEAVETSRAGITTLLGGPGAARVVVTVEIQGEATGALWLVLAEEDAELLAARLTAHPGDSFEAGRAALARAAGRVAASALGAMGRFTGLVLEPGAPLLRLESSDALGAELSGQETVLVLVAQLHAPGLVARFLFLPDADSLPVLLRSLRV